MTCKCDEFGDYANCYVHGDGTTWALLQENQIGGKRKDAMNDRCPHCSVTIESREVLLHHMAMCYEREKAEADRAGFRRGLSEANIISSGDAISAVIKERNELRIRCDDMKKGMAHDVECLGELIEKNRALTERCAGLSAALESFDIAYNAVLSGETNPARIISLHDLRTASEAYHGAAPLLAKVKADVLRNAASEVRCVTSQLPGFKGGCADDGLNPCMSCLAAARLEGQAKSMEAS